MKIEESNKLIAEFMGMECVIDEDCPGDDEYEWLPRFEHSNWCFKSPPPFNSRWDWLMPVVEKIESFAAVTIINKGCKIETLDREFTSSGITTLDATYTAVTEFIQWYNTTKKK